MSGKLVKENKCLVDIDIETLKEEIMKATLELAYPIGKEYVTQEDINPATILGFGTWERLKGKVLVGLNEEDEYFNEIGKEGGETTHTLTVDEMPSHTHTYTKTNVTLKAEFDRTFTSYGADSATQSNVSTSSTGGGTEFNITQPYKVVGYMWIRTA